MLSNHISCHFATCCGLKPCQWMSRTNTQTHTHTHTYKRINTFIFIIHGESARWKQSSECTHEVQEQGDPNSGDDILRACESCNPKTRQGVKRLLQCSVGRAHQRRDCGRNVEKEHSRLHVWKSAPSSSRRKKKHTQKKKKKRRGCFCRLSGASSRAAGKLDESTTSDRWFHKHSANRDHNKTRSVCDSSANAVSIQIQLQCISTLSFSQPKIKVTYNYNYGGFLYRHFNRLVW